MYAIRSYYDKGYRELYVVPADGGEVTRLTNTASNESNAAWRPDGEKIGFISSASGSSQLWEMNPDGSGPEQISDIDGGIAGFSYSPDSKKIAYIKQVKLDDDIHDLFPDLPKANARLESDIMYRHWVV